MPLDILEMSKPRYSPPMDLCATQVSIPASENVTSLWLLSLWRDGGSGREDQHAPPGCGEDSRCRGRQVARLPQPGDLFLFFLLRTSSSLLASPQIAHQRAWGFWQPAAVFSSAFASPTTSFEDFIMGLFIHVNECSGSSRARGYACMLPTVLIVITVETLHDLSSPILSCVFSIGWVSQLCAAQAKAL